MADKLEGESFAEITKDMDAQEMTEDDLDEVGSALAKAIELHANKVKHASLV